MMKHLIASVAVAALASATAFAHPVPTTTTEADTVDSTVFENLREIERNVAAISEHAAKLEQMNELPNTYTHSSHEYEWNRIDQRFDEAGKRIPALQKARGLGPWQAETLDEIASLMAAMGAQIESATTILTDTPAVAALHAKPLYSLRVKSVLRYAQMIDDHIEAIQMAQAMVS